MITFLPRYRDIDRPPVGRYPAPSWSDNGTLFRRRGRAGELFPKAVSSLSDSGADHRGVKAHRPDTYRGQLGQPPGGPERDQSGSGATLRLVMPASGSVTRGMDERLQLLQETCHEIRQPVAAVLALSDAALAAPGLPDVTRSYLQQIAKQAQSLAEVVRQGLTEDPSGARARLTDLGWLAEKAAAAERVTYEGKLEVISPSELVLVRVNRVDVHSIISNMLSNATRAAGPAGTVTIETSRDSGLAKLVVEDTGPGFGKAPSGTGLGWDIIARCLARCGGRISYGRVTLGGVRASFWLPLAAP
ncbi:MAG: hypothetical protein C5B60_05930 [Chloroflexi bacterium]|nr:MAG: hypothetical protein C5B60_05930 [Chloroflexota bacterium]